MLLFDRRRSAGRSIVRETAEFRVAGKLAPLLFRDDEGKRLGDGDFVRKISVSVEDERFQQIGQLQKQMQLSHGKAFFFGWQINRHYTKRELGEASWFHLTALNYFEPAGEECGTCYDQSSACPKCGSGAEQLSDLILDLRKAPKKKDFASTIAGEWIVSQRLAEILLSSCLTGFELRPARHRAKYEDDPVDLSKVPTGREILRRAEAAGMPHNSCAFTVWLNRAENKAFWEQAHAEHAELLQAKARRPLQSLPTWYQVVVLSAVSGGHDPRLNGAAWPRGLGRRRVPEFAFGAGVLA